MNARRLSIGLVFAAGMLLSAVVLPARADEIVRLGHNRAWSNPALLLGLANGEFKKSGVDVVEHQFTNPADIITAMVSGDIDAGASPGPTLFTAAVQGAKVRAVALLQGTNNPPIAYTVRADDGITSVQDLRGKTAGVSNYGGTYDIYLRYWIEKHGLDPRTP
jgi:NitT/TauT family transport system substrate-binding protein